MSGLWPLAFPTRPPPTAQRALTRSPSSCAKSFSACSGSMTAWSLHGGARKRPQRCCLPHSTAAFALQSRWLITRLNGSHAAVTRSAASPASPASLLHANRQSAPAGIGRRPATRSTARRMSSALLAFSAASTNNCSKTSCCVWLPPKAVHFAQHRAHQRQRLGMAPLGMGQLCLGNRQHAIAHDRCHRASSLAIGAQRLYHAPGRAGAIVGNEGHHPVRQREGGLAVADARLGLVGQFLPARTDVHTQPLQAKQHGRGVLHVDVHVGRGHGQGCSQVAKARVVQIQRRRRITVLQLEQRTVPPQMVLQVVAAFPVRCQ